MLSLLIVQFPRLLAGALLALFAWITARRARRGVHPCRVFGASAIGLLVAASSGGIGNFAAMWMWIWFQSLRPRSASSWPFFNDGLRSIPSIPAPLLWLGACIAWSLAAGSLGVGLAHRRRLPGFRGVWAGAVAGRRVGPWVWSELGGALGAVLLFWRLLDFTDLIVLGEWQAIYEGRSRLELRAQTTPTPVSAVASHRVRRLELAPPSSFPTGAALYALAQDQDGQLWEWALDGYHEDAVRPIETASPVTAFHVWSGTPCFLGEDGQLQCASRAADGRRAASPLWPGVRVRSFAAARTFAEPSRLCAVAHDGEGHCWDGRESGSTVFGVGLRALEPDWSFQGCAVRLDGSAFCRRRPRGAHDDGEERIEGVERVVSLSSSAEAACAVSEDGTLHCWGGGGSHAVDDGKGGRAWKSRQIPSRWRVDEVAVGSSHTCAVASGRVLCWGDNTWGELCDGSTHPRTDPIDVPGVTDAVSVVVGFRRTCIVRSGGEVACCGVALRYPPR